jgi:hypothetical protein
MIFEDGVCGLFFVAVSNSGYSPTVSNVGNDDNKSKPDSGGN